MFNRKAIEMGTILTLMTVCRGFQPRHVSLLRRRSKSTESHSNLDELMDDLLNGKPVSSSSVSPEDRQSSMQSTPDGANSAPNSTGWRTIQWDQLSQDDYVANDIISKPSPVDTILVKNRLVYVKRDDLLKLPASQVSGNKARKLWTLENLKRFPGCIVSYGGPQSNAMVALAAVAHFRNAAQLSADGGGNDSAIASTRFVYYSKKLPKFLRQRPSGNFFRAQSLGMELVELPHDQYNVMFGGDSGGSVDPPNFLEPPVPGNSVWIPQGGACAVAWEGARRLATEIHDYWKENGNGKSLVVVLPGGTCTTALLLHRSLDEIKKCGSEVDIEVLVIPCVAEESYAKRQMMSLNAAVGAATDDIPMVLPPNPKDFYFGQPSGQKAKGYFQFGKPDRDILDTFRYMKDDCNLLLDLLYGSPAWSILLRHWKFIDSKGEESLLGGKEVMYVHSGGLEGVNSQLLRYQYEGFVTIDEVQVPGKDR